MSPVHSPERPFQPVRVRQGAPAARPPSAQEWFSHPVAIDVMDHLPLGPRSLATLAATFPQLDLQAPQAAPAREIRPWGPAGSAAVPLRAARHFTALLQAVELGELNELGLAAEELGHWSAYADSPEAAQEVQYRIAQLPQTPANGLFLRVAGQQLFGAWLVQSLQPDFVHPGPSSFVRLNGWLYSLAARHQTPEVQQALLASSIHVGLPCDQIATQQRIAQWLLHVGASGMRLHPTPLATLKGAFEEVYRRLPHWRAPLQGSLAAGTEGDSFWRSSSATYAEPWLSHPKSAVQRATTLLDILEPAHLPTRLLLYSHLIEKIEDRQLREPVKLREPAMLMALFTRIAQAAAQAGPSSALYAKYQTGLGHCAAASRSVDTARAAAYALRFFGQSPQAQTVRLLVQLVQRPNLSPTVLETALDSLASLCRRGGLEQGPALAAMLHLLQLGAQKPLGEAAYRGLMDLHDERWLREPLAGKLVDGLAVPERLSSWCHARCVALLLEMGPHGHDAASRERGLEAFSRLLSRRTLRAEDARFALQAFYVQRGKYDQASMLAALAADTLPDSGPLADLTALYHQKISDLLGHSFARWLSP